MGRRLIFVGPTQCADADKAGLLSGGFEFLPPARRGDIQQLLTEPPGVIVLVDGRFHQCPAVGHAELRQAVELGWTVWGVSSMGAIRAFEMRHLGVRGYGSVYRHFLAQGDFQDDEVTLIHAAEPPFDGVTEPLIHLRYFLEFLTREALLSRAAASKIARNLKEQWYGYRTIALTLELISREVTDMSMIRVLKHSDDFGRFRVKEHDLRSFIREEVWHRTDVTLETSALPVPLTDATCAAP